MLSWTNVFTDRYFRRMILLTDISTTAHKDICFHGPKIPVFLVVGVKKTKQKTNPVRWMQLIRLCLHRHIARTCLRNDNRILVCFMLVFGGSRLVWQVHMCCGNPGQYVILVTLLYIVFVVLLCPVYLPLNRSLVMWSVPSLPRWPSGYGGCGRSGVRIPLATGFFRVECSDFKIGTPMATLPGAWHYRVSAVTGRPGVSILWLGEVESLICNFYLSVADPSLTYTSMLLGR